MLMFIFILPQAEQNQSKRKEFLVSNQNESSKSDHNNSETKVNSKDDEHNELKKWSTRKNTFLLCLSFTHLFV